MSGNYRPEDGSADEDDDTGYITPDVGSLSSPASLSSLRSIAEYTWLSYFLLTLGGLIVVQALWEFAKAKKAEMLLIASNGPSGSSAGLDTEETVPASLAAGYELSSIVSSGSGSGSGSGHTDG